MPLSNQYPNELADIMADLSSNEVIIKYREGAMGCFPPALPGKPGNIVIEKGAKREIDAYQVEIEIAKKLPKDVREEMIKRLETLRDEEVNRYV